MPIAKICLQRITAKRATEILCLNDHNDAIWFDENDVDTVNVSDINSPNENDGTTMPVIKDTKEWIRSLWTKDVFILH